MATFKTIKDRIKLIIGNRFEDKDISALVNRVHQEEVESHEWHDRRGFGELSVLGIESSGTVAVSQGGTTVTGTSTAFDATYHPGAYIRIGTGYPQLISAVASTTSLTLSTAWPYDAETEAAIEIFPIFYSLTSDCYRVIEIFRQERLKKRTRRWIYQHDPDRESSSDESTHWAPADETSSGIVRVELWPINAAPIVYGYEYLKGHTDMIVDSARPLVPSTIIENKALWDACQSLYNRTGEAKWRQSAVDYMGRYEKEREKQIEEDEHRYGVLHQVQDEQGEIDYDYDYLTSHDIE